MYRAYACIAKRILINTYFKLQTHKPVSKSVVEENEVQLKKINNLDFVTKPEYNISAL